jgi:hypothetical protein
MIEILKWLRRDWVFIAIGFFPTIEGYKLNDPEWWVYVLILDMGVIMHCYYHAVLLSSL